MVTKGIAIIGIAGRFPQADNIREFNVNLRSGKDSVRPISDARKVSTQLANDADYQIMGFLERIDTFDYPFFNIPFGEAVHMDPHQRLILESVYHAIENSCYSADALRGTRTSVYAGDTNQEYYKNVEEYHPTLLTGNLNATTAGRIARMFNFTGNALMVDTACSSSMVALHLACNDLLLGDSDQSLVCGISLVLSPGKKNTEDELGIDSADGKARAFSSDASGTSTGEAVACVILKRLEDAIRDRDIIHAVIRGTAVNQDAARSSSLAAPSSIAQAEVITRAWRKSGINPQDISFIEAHGTGTPLGDPIEIEGISSAFAQFTSKKQFCAISSVKSMIGHTDTAAGLVSLVKAVLSIRSRTLFPSLHFKSPNPHISFIHSPVYVNDKTRAWVVENGKSRIAAVSSFGISGTNCHVVLEEYVEEEAHYNMLQPGLITVSAKTTEGLTRNIQALLGDIATQNHCASNLGYSLCVGKNHYPFRFAWTGNDLNNFQLKAQEYLSRSSLSSATPDLEHTWIYFTGEFDVQAKQLIEISDQFPAFRKELQRCGAATLNELGDFSNSPRKLQFIYQYCLFQFLVSAGINIKKLTGNGLGKIVVKVITGVLEFAEALSLVEAGTPQTDFSQDKLKLFATTKLVEPNALVLVVGSDRMASAIFSDSAATVIHHEQTNLNDILRLLKDIYLAGLTPEWNSVYDHAQHKRVETTNYSFSRLPCWIKATTGKRSTTNEKIGKWFHKLTWKEEAVVHGDAIKGGTFLFFRDGSTLCTTLAERFEAHGNRLINVTPGRQFCQRDMYHYEFNAANELDFALLAQHVAASSLAGIVYAIGIDKPNPVTAVMLPTQMFWLYKTFYPEIQKPAFRLIHISSGALRVFEEEIDPEKHAATGLLKAILSEQIMLKVNGIDVISSGNEQSLADEIWAEVCGESTVRYSALRNGRRYIQLFESAFEPSQPEAKLYRNGATYLISGGGSGVGLLVARSIAERVKCNLILIGRRPLHRKTEDTPEQRDERREIFNEIEKLGSKILYCCGDIADRKFVEESVAKSTLLYGKIDGVVHAAGVTGTRWPLDKLTTNDFLNTLQAKVYGSQILCDVFRNTKLDFIVFFSSLNTAVPQRFTSDYTVANAYLDALAISLRSKGLNALAINWGAWGQAGAGARVDIESEENKRSLLRAWSNADGLHAFHSAMRHDSANILIADISEKLFANTSFFRLNAREEVRDRQKLRLCNPGYEKFTPLQQQLLGIWSDALQSDELKMDDNFFQIGGHSLIGARIVQRIGKELNIKINFRNLLENPSVKMLSVFLSRNNESKQVFNSAPITKVKESTSYVLSHAQKRLWVLHQIPGNELAYVIAKSFLLKNQVDSDTFRDVIVNLMNRHEILRTVYQEIDGEPRQVVLPVQSDYDAFAYHDFTINDSPESKHRTLFADITSTPFDLSRGPLFRVALCKLREDEYGLILCMHHLVTDDESMKILLSEIMLTYHSFRNSHVNVLAPLRITYKDYAAWSNAQLDSVRLAALSGYWHGKFEIPATNLSDIYDWPQNITTSNEGGVHHFTLGQKLVSNLNRARNGKDVSLFMLLLSISKTLLFRYTGQEDITVGIPVSGREHPDLDGQIGFFVNTLPIRTTFAGTDLLEDLMRKVKQSLLDAYAHQEYPYDLLLNDLRNKGAIKSEDLFSVFVSYLTDNPGYTGEKNEYGFETSLLEEANYRKFELEIEFYEREGEVLVSIIYSKHHFSANAILSMEKHFVRLIEDIELNMNQPLIDLILDNHENKERRNTNRNFVFDF